MRDSPRDIALQRTGGHRGGRTTCLTAAVWIWPLVAHAHTNDGSVAIFGTGAMGFVLEAISSLRFAAKTWLVMGGLVVSWIVLFFSGDESTGDYAFRMFLAMILLMPIPFLAGFLLGKVMQRRGSRGSPRKERPGG